MKVSDYIAAFLHKQGITAVFEMAGGMITHILDSIASYKEINIISMHHEQAASFAADGYARITGRPGVALATSGPGATNLLTGIAGCYFDSIPAIFITGQVNLHEQKGNRAIRQLGFQETDIASMAAPVTKAVFCITEASQIKDAFEQAFTIAISGRPGPVLIDIPMNLQRSEIEVDTIRYIEKPIARITGDLDFETIFSLIKGSKRPVVLAGGGIRAAGALSLFEKFIEITGLPVITSLLGIDVLPRSNSSNVGFLGSYGNRWANLSIGEADLILVLGSRLDIRQTGADVGFFASKTMIHVDCEIGELNNRLKNCHIIHEDLVSFLEAAVQYVEQKNIILDAYSDWKIRIDVLRETWPDVNELMSIKGINPNVFMHQVSHKAGNIKAWIADVGNHQMWAAQSLELGEGQRFLTSGGMGAMGYALPAAIGACIASKQAVVVIAGDGGVQLNIQELQTIFRNNLPVKIIVINNNNLGMIRQFQDSYFDSRYQSTFWGYTAPDFEKVAKAYGIDAQTIDSEEQITPAVDWLVNEDCERKPKLLQVVIDSYANAYPKIAFGKPLTEMEPYAKPLEMEGT